MTLRTNVVKRPYLAVYAENGETKRKILLAESVEAARLFVPASAQLLKLEEMEESDAESE